MPACSNDASRVYSCYASTSPTSIYVTIQGAKVPIRAAQLRFSFLPKGLGHKNLPSIGDRRTLSSTEAIPCSHSCSMKQKQGPKSQTEPAGEPVCLVSCSSPTSLPSHLAHSLRCRFPTERKAVKTRRKSDFIVESPSTYS